MTTFELIKKLARKQGLTLAQLNDKAGLGKNSIYHWSNKTPSTDNLQKVADVLNVSVDYLLGNTDNPSPDTGNKGVDLADPNPFLRYQGKEVSQEDIEIFKRLIRGKQDE